MRKISVLFLLCILLILPVCAAGQGYVYDDAGLFTDAQVQELNDWAEEISEQHNFGVYIHTTEDFTQSGYFDVFEYAKDYYISQNFGKGSNSDGVMLMLSMADRDYQMLFNGSVSDMAFTETGRDDMERNFLSYFRNGDYYGGFKAYLGDCDSCLTAYEAGTPIGSGTDHSATGYIPYYEEPVQRSFNLWVSLIPGLIAAAIIGGALSIPMRSAKQKRDAAGYADGNIQLTRREDIFLHRTVTRTPKSPPPSSSGGGGGSFHQSSGSFSGRSGKF